MARIRESPSVFQDRIRALAGNPYDNPSTSRVARSIREGIRAAAGLGDVRRLTVVNPLIDALECVSRLHQLLGELAACDIEVRRRPAKTRRIT